MSEADLFFRDLLVVTTVVLFAFVVHPRLALVLVILLLLYAGWMIWQAKRC